MKQDLFILEEDKEIARRRIAEIEDEIQSLGPAFYNAFNETSETYHDNAQFEIVRDKQTLLAAERHRLRQALANSALNIPKQQAGIVGIGSTVETINQKTGKTHLYFIAGDWSPRAGHIAKGALIVSRQSPIGQILIGRKIGDKLDLRSMNLEIVSISQ